jgi:hypothetical protein
LGLLVGAVFGVQAQGFRSGEFTQEIAKFEQAVINHAEREETEEFPFIRSARSHDQLVNLAGKLIAAEKTAPTHPHPSAAGSTTAQRTMGPFASLVDRARDAIGSHQS